MKRLLAFFLLAAIVRAELIPSARLITWTPGTHTGVVGGIPDDYTESFNAVTEGVDNTGSTNSTTALNALIAASTAGTYVYLPEGDYRLDSQLDMKTGVVLRGAGPTTRLINNSASRAISMGPTNGFVVPAGATEADMTVSAGLTKGSTTLTIGDPSTLSVGQMVMILQDIDEDVPHVSVFVYRFLTKQVVRVTAKDEGANTITFFPPLYDSYGAGAITVKIVAPADQIEDSGVEDLLINMTAAGQNGVEINQGYGCWVKNVVVEDARNYPFSISDSLHCEVRRCISEPRNASGTSGAGIIVARASGLLIEDNIIFDNWITEIMVNDGSSGNLISRNFSTGPHFVDTNHAPNNQFNLYEGNVNSGFKSDGYFGGERYLTIFRNKTKFASLYRFTRDASLVGNIYGSATQTGAGVNRHGYPNFGNDGFTGTATYYPSNQSDDWRDRVVTGEITSVTKGTGTGYLVAHGGGYSAGVTAITVDTGSGTILVGDIVTFGAAVYRYRVTDFSGGVITISTNTFGTTGLIDTVADNAAVTISSDTGTMTVVGGGFRDNGPFGAMYIMLAWNSYGVYQQYRVETVVDDLVTIISTATDGTPNQIALPTVGTDLVIGMGQDLTVFQEKDLGVVATIIEKGNRYADGGYDSLGGDALPDSLAYAAKPAWITAAEAELSTTFPWPEFDPVTPLPAGDSDIPAGYRYTYTLESEWTTASINADGTVLSIGANKPMFIGAGGAPNATLSGGVTCTFSHIIGATMYFTPSRVIVEDETLTVSVTNPANGFEDVNGNDLPNLTAASVSNASSATTGVEHFGPDVAITDTDAIYGDSNNTIIQPTTVTVNGTALGVRFYVLNNTYDALVRATICDEAFNILGSGTGTVTGEERWMFIPVTSFAVTSGSVYSGTVQFLANGDPTLRSIAAQPSGSAYVDDDTAFGEELPIQFVSPDPQVYEWAIQIRVAADAIVGTTTFSGSGATTLSGSGTTTITE